MTSLSGKKNIRCKRECKRQVHNQRWRDPKKYQQEVALSIPPCVMIVATNDDSTVTRLGLLFCSNCGSKGRRAAKVSGPNIQFNLDGSDRNNEEIGRKKGVEKKNSKKARFYFFGCGFLLGPMVPHGKVCRRMARKGVEGRRGCKQADDSS